MKTILCSALAAGAVFSSLQASAETPYSIPEPGFPQCMGVQLKPDGWNEETISTVQSLGFKIIRRGFYWNAVEKEKGVYDFSGFDKEMAHAKKLGFTVVGCLFSSNKLYENPRGGVQTEAARQGFAAFAAACAKRYADQPVVWEIWNEPNVRTFWRKDGTHNSKEFAKEYSDLVNTVAPVMKKANPKCVIAAGSVSNYWKPSYEWTEYCFQNGVLKSGIDAWSVHPYGVRNPEEHGIGHEIERELLRKYGAPDMPMVNTERGYAAKATATGEGWSGSTSNTAFINQANSFMRQLLVDQYYDVRFSVWYEWGGNEGFALVDGNGPRPAVDACKEMVAQLSGYKIAEKVKTDSEQDWILVLDSCDGKAKPRKLAAWTCPPVGGTPDEIWPHEVAVSFEGGKTRKLALTGRPVFVTLDKSEVKVISAVTTTPKPKAADVRPVVPEGGRDLGLFVQGAPWNFVENTGKGSLTMEKQGDVDVGVLQYDFSKSKSKQTPYVLASIPIAVDGAAALCMYARSPIAQQLTFRVTDATGQTLQFKTRLKGTGGWESIKIPLDRKLENWGGAKDGFAHWPLIVLDLLKSV